MTNSDKNRGLLILITTIMAVFACHPGWGQEQQPNEALHNHLFYRHALKKVTIKQVDFEELSLREALDILAFRIENESNKQIIPNFIINDPDGEFKNRPVTLKLKNLPADNLLGYIVNHVRGSVRFERYAIIISPRRPPR